MATMTKNATTGNYELEITPSDTDQTFTFNIAEKFSKSNIEVKVMAVPKKYVHNIQLRSSPASSTPNLAISFALKNTTASAYTSVSDVRAAIADAGYNNYNKSLLATGKYATSSSAWYLVIGVFAYSGNDSYIRVNRISLNSTSAEISNNGIAATSLYLLQDCVKED